RADRIHVPGQAHRVQQHARAVRTAPREVDRELHHGKVWIMPESAERKALSEGLQKLNENVGTMAELSELAIRKAVDSLARMNQEEAREVFTLDAEIFSLQRVIEKTCTDLIALHAPVARDLRTITTCLKLTTDLDRIGRYEIGRAHR